MNGTQHEKKTFSLPASAGSKTICGKVGHAWADRKGKCVRCGEKLRDVGFTEAEKE